MDMNAPDTSGMNRNTIAVAKAAAKMAYSRAMTPLALLWKSTTDVDRCGMECHHFMADLRRKVGGEGPPFPDQRGRASARDQPPLALVAILLYRSVSKVLK